MEKDLNATHKRQLDEMRGDLEKRQEADSQERTDMIYTDKEDSRLEKWYEIWRRPA